jgi:regulator of protease activity HflC (stomatin/prohibitin superfamily)
MKTVIHKHGGLKMDNIGLMDIIGLSGTNIFFIVFGLFTIILIYLGIQNVLEGSVRLVERFGKYHKTLRPGINFTLPGIDRIKKDFELYTYHFDPETKRIKKVSISHTPSAGDINMKEQIIDPDEFNTIAADNAVIFPDIICYFTIIDAHKAVYNVDNLGESLLKLIETTIRQEVGKQNSDDLITSRQQIGLNVQQELEKATESWGTKITRVEIQDIKFDESLQDNLVKQREAELVKRGEVVEAQQEKEVMITRAEGIRQKEILEAEGKKQAQILEAEGNFEAARLEAEGKYLIESRGREGEAKGMLAMGEALKENPEGLIILDALQAQAKVAASIGESSNALIIPSETAGLFGAIGSITKTLKMMENGFSFSENQSDTNHEKTEEGEIDKS